MSDYIKREEVYDQLDRWARDLNNPQVYQRDDARCVIDGIPSADVAPVRHGRWVVIDAEEPRRYGCSECKRLSWHMENYCPNCGARMDEDGDESDD